MVNRALFPTPADTPEPKKDAGSFLNFPNSDERKVIPDLCRPRPDTPRPTGEWRTPLLMTSGDSTRAKLDFDGQKEDSELTNPERKTEEREEIPVAKFDDDPEAFWGHPRVKQQLDEVAGGKKNLDTTSAAMKVDRTVLKNRVAKRQWGKIVERRKMTASGKRVDQPQFYKYQVRPALSTSIIVECLDKFH